MKFDSTKNSQKDCFQKRLKVTLAKKTAFCFLAISVILGAGMFTIPSTSALTPSTAIQPIYVDFKFHKKPVICIFGSDEKAINVGVDSVLEWQNNLRDYTRDSNSWEMTITVNPQNISSCSTEIHFVKGPTLFPDVIDAQGITMVQADRAVVEVYTTQYYDPTAFKLVKDGSNKWRPVAGEFADVPPSHLKSVTEHEFGHVLGLSHQKDNSIMVTGHVIAHISDKDCQGVVAKYGEDWPSISLKNYIFTDSLVNHALHDLSRK
jgi:hypothetical protein